MRYILSMIMVLVLVNSVYGQFRPTYGRFTPTPQMRIDQIYHQEHINRAPPMNWIDHPPYRYHYYSYPPVYVPYQNFYRVPYLYGNNFSYGFSIYNGNGFYLNYNFNRGLY